LLSLEALLRAGGQSASAGIFMRVLLVHSLLVIDVFEKDTSQRSFSEGSRTGGVTGSAGFFLGSCRALL